MKKRIKAITGWTFLCLVIIVIFRRVLGVMSINTFMFLDNLLFTSDGMAAFIMWAIVGLLVGAIAGAVVAFKKYKLTYSSVLIPVFILLFFLGIMYLVNQPINHETTSLERKTINANPYVTVSAKGTLPDYKNISYSPINLLDYNDNTAWICADDDSREINFVFLSSVASMSHVQCVAFRIKNGYGKTKKIYNNHNRVQRFSVYNNNNLIGTYPVYDYYDSWQDVAITPVIIKESDVISVRIEATYAGNKYADQTAITELFPILEYYAK